MPMQMQPGCMADIADYIANQLKASQQALVKVFEYVGESCIAEARVAGNYTDRTGNLRSSIGYVIVVDGKVQKTVIVSPSKGDDKSKGKTSAVNMLKELVHGYPNGVALVIVAGMNYAGYVEARNYNVLLSAEQLSKTMLPMLLRQLKIA